jgi:hypothetical protein
MSLQQHGGTLARDQAHRLVGAVRGDDHRAALLQHLGQQLARVGLVVDQQDLDAGEVDQLVARRAHRAGLSATSGATAIGVRSFARIGSRSVKVAPRSVRGCSQLDGAAVQLDDVADDRQADAQPAVAALAAAVELTKAIEHERHEIGAMPAAGVATSTTTSLPAAVTSRLDAAARGVNLMAFDSKFQIACCRRPASPENSSGSGPTRRSSVIPSRLPRAARRRPPSRGSTAGRPDGSRCAACRR